MVGSKADAQGAGAAGDGPSVRARTLVVLREIVGVSQRELAAEVGVTEKLLSRWSRGKSEPSAAELGRYLEALGLTFATYELVLSTIETVDLVRAGARDDAVDAALLARYADRIGVTVSELVRYFVVARGGDPG